MGNGFVITHALYDERRKDAILCVRSRRQGIAALHNYASAALDSNSLTERRWCDPDNSLGSDRIAAIIPRIAKTKTLTALFSNSSVVLWF